MIYSPFKSGAAWCSGLNTLLETDGLLSCVSLNHTKCTRCFLEHAHVQIYPHSLVLVDAMNGVNHDLHKQNYFVSQSN